MARPATVDEYLSSLPERSRMALEELRRTIREAAPEATETITYDMPAFRAHGHMLVSYAAFKDHCSLFPMSIRVIDAHDEELKPYRATRGTLHFDPDHPIPADVVRSLVRARVEENAARRSR